MSLLVRLLELLGEMGSRLPIWASGDGGGGGGKRGGGDTGQKGGRERKRRTRKGKR